MNKRLSEMTQAEKDALSCAEIAALVRAAAVDVLGEAKVAEVLATPPAPPAAPAGPTPAALAASRREAMVAAHGERAGYWPSCAGAPPARRRRRKAA